MQPEKERERELTHESEYTSQTDDKEGWTEKQLEVEHSLNDRENGRLFLLRRMLRDARYAADVGRHVGTRFVLVQGRHAASVEDVQSVERSMRFLMRFFW